MSESQCNGDGQKFYGKYRGIVLDNVDVEFLGRILANVAAVPASVLNWAMPCVPYAGPQVGFYTMPPIGANVWIEYEGGDPNFPIWSGCFWGEGELPLEAPPDTKVFKTEFITMILNDLPEVGGFTLECIDPAVDVPLSMYFNSEGIKIICPEAVITMTPESITLTVPESVISMTAETIETTVPPSTVTMTAESIVTNSPAINVTAEGDITEEAGGALSLKAGADIDIGAIGEISVKGGGAAQLMGGGDVGVFAGGAVTITAADVAVTGEAAVEISAPANIEISSASIMLNGIVEVDGGLLEDGMPVMIAP